MERQALAAAFARRFGRGPDALVRAPGRVNLIGEHTDYSNLPVLPIAIDRATHVAVAAVDGTEVIACSGQFDGEARLDRADLGPVTAPWQRYIVGVLSQLVGMGRGAWLLVDGDLPTTGGLSSSSAFTMGLLAALNRAWDLSLELEQLVQMGIVAERHVGVESGGMDQTVIAHARTGAALRIDFAPPRQRAVPLPPGLHVVVAYSGEEAPKGGSAREAYNERVVGCRLAAALLADRLGVSTGSPPVLGEVANAALEPDTIEALPEEASAEIIARELHVAAEPLVRLTAGRFDARQPVRIRRVAAHVLGEARRVDLTERALAEGDLEGLGRLLDASHHSLARDFCCSTQQLDRLCQAMREAGALGARLTGAGFGGYALAVVPAERVAPVIEAGLAVSGGPAFETRAAAGLEVVSSGTGP